MGATAHEDSHVDLEGHPSPTAACLHCPGFAASHSQPAVQMCVKAAPSGHTNDCEMSTQRDSVPPCTGCWHQPQFSRFTESET